MPASGESTSSNSMQAQINALRESMNTGFNELKSMLTSMDNRLRSLEQTEAGCRGVQELRLQALDKALAAEMLRIATVENKAEALEAELTEIKPIMRTIKWVGGILGASIMALIWAMITGQVQLLFK